MTRSRMTRWFAAHPSAARSLLGLLAAAALVGAVVLVLGPLSWLIAGDAVSALTGKEQADAINAVRQTVLAALGGASALIALGFTVRTYYLSRRGQVTDRFGKAVGQLASDKLEERLGGVHALEHVMSESAVDHTAVIGVLCSFVRARTMRERNAEGEYVAEDDDPELAWIELPADVDAAMTALARRPRRDEPNRPDLRAAKLVGLSARSMDFSAPPRLTRMFLTSADLRRADLRGADLRGTIASAADLRHALLHRADLRRASFSGADFRGAHLNGALLAGAMFEGSDLRDVTGLTAGQLSEAYVDTETRFSPELADDPWVQARLADCVEWTEAHDDPWACPPPTRWPSAADT
ncbi:pentapeptide repeat-containing protein [Nonomuraea sp. NPDC003804]|uniref:pentapeptide repeat-containing protein n=1 Tax=Nonomuraea sp. NPDC003804 TaxID=3154547 RepID=UPI0033A0A0B6